MQCLSSQRSASSVREKRRVDTSSRMNLLCLDCNCVSVFVFCVSAHRDLPVLLLVSIHHQQPVWDGLTVSFHRWAPPFFLLLLPLNYWIMRNWTLAAPRLVHVITFHANEYRLYSAQIVFPLQWFNYPMFECKWTITMCSLCVSAGRRSAAPDADEWKNLLWF